MNLTSGNWQYSRCGKKYIDMELRIKLEMPAGLKRRRTWNMNPSSRILIDPLPVILAREAQRHRRQ